MNVVKRATSEYAVLCHVNNYEQLTVEHGECQSLDSKNR